MFSLPGVELRREGFRCSLPVNDSAQVPVGASKIMRRRHHSGMPLVSALCLCRAHLPIFSPSSPSLSTVLSMGVWLILSACAKEERFNDTDRG